MVDTLLAFALQRFGKPFFEHAWLDFWHGEPPDADEFSDIPEFDAMFIPWFVTAFVRDPNGEGVDPAWPDEPIGLHWLRTDRPRIDALEREWLLAACASPMSVFVVEAVEPGQSLDIRDVFTGRRFHVLEQTASRTVRRTDLLFVRVITAGDLCLMFGMAPFVVPARLHLTILDWRDRVFRRRTPTRRVLMDPDVEMRDLYLELATEIQQPSMPQLQNTDGDPLEPTTLIYGLTSTVAHVLERLKPLATIGEVEHVSDVETDEGGTVTSAVVSWVKAGNRKYNGWDNTVLGTIRLEDGRLTAEVNSTRRANRLEKELKRLLGTTAGLRDRSVGNIDVMLQELKGARARSAEGAPGPQAERERPPEFAALEDELHQQHLAAWCDTRVPALGDRTPRQVVCTVRGRERVEALLASFEGSDVRSRPARREALDALRRTLGLEHPPAR